MPVRCAVIVAALLPLTVSNADAGCRLALTLAMDISSSVDADEDALQRQGMAKAMTSPDVIAAFTAGDPVALAVYEWSGRYQQDLLMDWVIIESPDDVLRAAATLGATKRSYAEFPTAVGFAVDFAVDLFGRAPECMFRTLDISGDGANNDGFSPLNLRPKLQSAGVTVNALSIGGATDDDAVLAAFFRDEVIFGPGAFVERAKDYTDYQRALERKLIRELGMASFAALLP